MKISCVAAMDENRVIGDGEDIPWHLPADLKHFRELTLEHPIVMGRRTHESIGTVLDQRTNIVLTRDENYDTFGDCLVVHSKDQALHAAGETGADETMIIGGESVYEMFLPESNVLYLTVVHGEFEGSVYFPEVDATKWTLTEIEDHEADEENPHDYSFLTLKKNGRDKRDQPASKFPLPDFLGG